jgi:hypothetical protein
MPDIMDGWTQKPWSVTEEMWKRKAKGLEDQYQRLLSDHQDLRLEKAKMMGELRVLQRYKETAEDTISREVASRKCVSLASVRERRVELASPMLSMQDGAQR